MDDKVVYRPIEPGEEHTVIDLVARSFRKFVASDCSREGVEEFFKYAQADSLYIRTKTGHDVLVAEIHNQIVGMIEVRDYEHISMFFVEETFHNSGIVKELLRRSLEVCRSNVPDLCRLSVNASLYAVRIYRHLGFRRKAPQQLEKGIRFVPMVLELS